MPYHKLHNNYHDNMPPWLEVALWLGAVAMAYMCWRLYA